MEMMKSFIPAKLRKVITESTSDDLPSTCASLLEFFKPLPQFQQVIRELTDPELSLCEKNKETAVDFKRKGNEMFSAGNFEEAIGFYTQALRCAPLDANDMGRNLMATIYVNRASSLQKIGRFSECMKDCNRAIRLYPQYIKAWYRRGKANASVGNYYNATRDLEVALSIECSSGEKNKIKSEMEVIMNIYMKTNVEISSSCGKESENDLISTEPCKTAELRCVSILGKGRGMISLNDILPSSLVHLEEPYVAVISKSCRDSHCHFCFNLLPLDAVPCPSCRIPLYCSDLCMQRAGGKQSSSNKQFLTVFGHDSEIIHSYVKDTVYVNDNLQSFFHSMLDYHPEHRHECGGSNWAAVLPPEAVLAGRIMSRSIDEGTTLHESLNLCHNYGQVHSEYKLELHIYSLVLSYCLKRSYGPEFTLSENSISQLIILMCQVRINSIAIVHFKSVDPNMQSSQERAVFATQLVQTTHSVEQVRVGQAIYSLGSLFNHSCQPNIHAYFLSRTLIVRSLEFIPSGNELELSYGPQVGQWGFLDRKQLLESQYSFNCYCAGCSEINLSDLVIHSFRCVKPNCLGVISDQIRWMQEIAQPLEGKNKEIISPVAHHLVENIKSLDQLGPGCCLSCGCYRNLESLKEEEKKAIIGIQRLEQCKGLKETCISIIRDALKSFSILKSTRHSYSKDIAQAEDKFAEAFCSVGDFQSALKHCKASVEILVKLYHPSHIVIGNELFKLASIQLSLGDLIAAMESVKRADAIFSIHYGPHVEKLFPFVLNLKEKISDVSSHDLIPADTIHVNCPPDHSV